MKSNVVIVLLIVLVVVNLALLKKWPFGFRNMKQGFQNQQVGAVNSSIPVVKPLTPAVPMMRNPPPTAPSVPMMPTQPQMMPAPMMPTPMMPTPMMAPQPPMLPVATPNVPAVAMVQPRYDASGHLIQGYQNAAEVQGAEYMKKEGFTTRYVDNAGGAKDQYQPIGAFDGVNLPTGNNVSVWRYTAPNEKLLGAEFVPGDDSLFMFKNNQCKPECCGASFSCSGGCVCTTKDQRNYIASRGGNVSLPDDNV